MNLFKKHTILVVDDDHDIRELLSQLLHKNGYDTLLACDGIEMMKQLAQSPVVHLIILDVMMPGEDGLSLLRRLPAVVKPPPPVLILSARGEEIDRIIGLEMGSDDYLVKPFHPRELLARVKSILRRHQPAYESYHHELDVVYFGNWLFDRTRRSLFKIPETLERKDWAAWIKSEAGETLNTIEYRLLRALTDHPQRVLSRDFLLDATIGRKYVPTDRTIDVQMSRLRNRLSDNARDASLIRTVRYEGYMLSSRIEKL